MLIDNALSPQLALELQAAGYDAVHVRDLGLATADDETILARALRDRRVVVSRDGDFAALLALANANAPSFVHLRVPGVNRPTEQLALIHRALQLAAAELQTGAIVTVRGDGIRIRELPVGAR